MNKVITLATDFGWGEYVAQMKGVILSINPKAAIIDITHSIKPQNILEGAYIIYSVAPYYSNGIHVGVVDPGVGTERKGLILECKNGFLVGPDNGLLIPCARNLGLKKIYKITERDYFLGPVSNTFHARDIFAPVASHLSLGVLAEEIGELVDEYVNLTLEYSMEKENTLEGKIIFIDSFGNLISSLPKKVIENYLDFGDQVKIELEGMQGKIQKNLRFLKSYGFGEKEELLSTMSSSGFFEISVNQGNAKKLLKVEVGTPIKLRF